MADEEQSFVHDLGEARSSRFRFKKRSRKEDDDSAEGERKRRKHHHGHRRHHRRHRSRESSPKKEDPLEATQGMNTETAFRESLFDAMADDEGAAYWEGVYGQPIHQYPNTKPSDPNDPDAELEQMSDEEYTAHVRARMWEKTHQHVLEERRLREEAAKKRKESKTRTEQMEAEKEVFDRRMEESLRKGAQRKKDKDWRESWAQYQRKWEQLLAHTKGRTGDEDIEGRDKDVTSRIPWPVQSGFAKDVSKDNVEGFFKHAARREGTENGLRLLLKTERVRWHPDRMSFSLRGQIDPTSLQQVTSVFQIVDDMYNSVK